MIEWQSVFSKVEAQVESIVDNTGGSAVRAKCPGFKKTSSILGVEKKIGVFKIALI